MEKLFNPKLEGKAVVILSSADGCVVARSPLAKMIGIDMGEPYFKVKQRFNGQEVISISANLELYGNLSTRFVNVVREFSPHVEQYSIDEIFMSMAGFNHIDLTKYAHTIKNHVYLGLGMPVSLGISTTKSLTKLATWYAKKHNEYDGVVNFNDMPTAKFTNIIKNIEVREVWGVGKKLTPQLNALDIHTVYDLKRANPELMRRKFSVLMAKTINELNGNPCIEIQELSQPKKQILRSRTFGRPVKTLDDLTQAISVHTSRAAEKLRQQKSAAGLLTVFIATSRFRPDDLPYSASFTVPIPSQTDNTLTLVRLAVYALKQIYRKGYNYSRSGIFVSELVPSNQSQHDFFSKTIPDAKSDSLMKTIDEINMKMGKNTIRVASAGFDHTWQPNAVNRSPCYTTRWDELLAVD